MFTPDNPEHYNHLEPQPWDVVDAWDLDRWSSAALEYIARAGRKPGEPKRVALTKAIRCLERAVYVIDIGELDQEVPEPRDRKPEQTDESVHLCAQCGKRGATSARMDYSVGPPRLIYFCADTNCKEQWRKERETGCEDSNKG